MDVVGDTAVAGVVPPLRRRLAVEGGRLVMARVARTRCPEPTLRAAEATAVRELVVPRRRESPIRDRETEVGLGVP